MSDFAFGGIVRCHESEAASFPDGAFTLQNASKRNIGVSAKLWRMKMGSRRRSYWCPMEDKEGHSNHWSIFADLL